MGLDSKRTNTGPLGIEAVSEPLPSLLDFALPHSDDFPDETWDELRREIQEIDRALARGAHEARNYLIEGSS